MIKIKLKGAIPSKKNNKQLFKNKKTGKMFISTSNDHKKWHEEATNQLTMQYIPRLNLEYVKVTKIIIYFSDLRKSDITNKVESINDLLVDYGLIKDDNWLNMPNLILSGVYKKNDPGCEIELHGIKEKYDQKTNKQTKDCLKIRSKK